MKNGFFRSSLFLRFLCAGFLLAATFWPAPAWSAAVPAAPADALAAHLEKAALQAARLQRQIEHPRGRPQAAAELRDLALHLERLQLATAALGPGAGALLEERRAALLDRLDHGERPAGKSLAPGVAGGGTILGVVTGPAGQPLAGVRVLAYAVGSFYAGSDVTDAAGAYALPELQDGAYYVGTDIVTYSSPYLNETYDDVHCPAYAPCHEEQATPVVVAGGGTVSGIDFRLAEGGKLRGRVRDEAGVALPGVFVTAYDAAGQAMGQTVTDAAGRYTVGRLMPGSYFLRATSDRHLDELYPDIPCEDGACNILSGVATAVTLDGQAIGLDFTLRGRATLRGRVLDAASRQPIAFADVSLHLASGATVRTVGSNADGEWEIGDLPPGTYFARAVDYGYQAQLFEGIACHPASCEVANGTPIVLTENGTLEAIDFALSRLGAIAGTVKAADTLAPLAERVEVYDAQGHYEDSGYGPSFLVTDLQPGSYFLVTDVWQFDTPYGDELWQNIPCHQGCDVTGEGTPVAVSLAQTTTGIDFLLDRLGSIEGRVLASGGAPLESVAVAAYSVATGQWVSYASTDENGDYRLERLTEGSYKVRAQRDDFRAELWDGVPCPTECNPALGQAVAVNLGQSTAGIDFTLERLGYLAGTVRDQQSGQRLSGIRIEIRTPDGGYVASATTDENGSFRGIGIADGTYLAVANLFEDNEYLAEIYDGVDCRSCDLTSGTPIAVSVGAPRLDIDFTLQQGGRIVGSVTSAAGLPLGSSGEVTAFDASGNPWGYVSIAGDGSYRLEGLGAGTYYLVARTSNPELAREVWPGVVCSPNADCDLLAGTPIEVQVGTTATADFVLDNNGSIEGRIVDAETGAPLPGGYVTLTNAAGLFLGSDEADEQGRYRFPGLAAGSYWVHTSSNDAHLEQVLGGETCENWLCDPTSGSPIAVQMGQETVAPDLPLTFGPGLAGEVLLGGVGVAGVGVDVFSLAGIHLGSTATGPSGRFRIAAPAGSYYVATDNGRGYVDEVHAGVACPAGPAYLGLCDPQDGTPVAVDGAAPATDGIDFDLASPLPGLFADGFESGGFGAWSQVLGGG